MPSSTAYDAALRRGADRIASTGPHIREHVVGPMLDLLDAFVAEAHKRDPHPYGHHNHHLCIHVNEWHSMLALAATSDPAVHEQTEATASDTFRPKANDTSPS